MVPLCGAVITWTTEKSSRKNVFQVRNTSCHMIPARQQVNAEVCSGLSYKDFWRLQVSPTLLLPEQKAKIPPSAAVS